MASLSGILPAARRAAHRVDQDIRNAIDDLRDFQGEILLRENIGKTTLELIEMWNTDHPEDPVEA